MIPFVPRTETVHTKVIIDGKLYSTEKAELIAEFSTADGDARCLHRTFKGNYFSTGVKGDSCTDRWGDSIAKIIYYDIQIMGSKKAKELIGLHDPDKYIELFGEVEEA